MLIMEALKDMCHPDSYLIVLKIITAMMTKDEDFFKNISMIIIYGEECSGKSTLLNFLSNKVSKKFNRVEIKKDFWFLNLENFYYAFSTEVTNILECHENINKGVMIRKLYSENIFNQNPPVVITMANQKPTCVFTGNRKPVFIHLNKQYTKYVSSPLNVEILSYIDTHIIRSKNMSRVTKKALTPILSKDVANIIADKVYFNTVYDFQELL